MLAAFEAAELEPDPRPARELAHLRGRRRRADRRRDGGQIAELARDTLRARLPRDRPARGARPARRGRGPRAGRLPATLSRKARARRSSSSASSRCSDRTVVGDRRRGGLIEARTASASASPARTVDLGGGRDGIDAGRMLGGDAGAEVDRAGRVAVGPDLTLPGHPEVLALGDMVRVASRDGTRGAAGPGAGRDAAGPLRGEGDPRAAGGRETEPFRYLDKGNLATIGRARSRRRRQRRPPQRASPPGSSGWSSTSTT